MDSSKAWQNVSYYIIIMSKLKGIIKAADIKFHEPNKLDEIIDKLFLWIFPDFIVPNHLTLFRYFTIPFIFFFLLYGNYKVGLIIFVISSFTDALDGAMARTRDKITNWGKLHDPLADKFLIGVAGAVLITRYISFEVILIIVILEFLTVISAIHLHDNKEKEIGARLPGKIKMVCQSIGLVFLLFGITSQLSGFITIAVILFYLAIFFSAANILLYRAL